VSHELEISGADDLARLAGEIGIVGQQARLEELVASAVASRPLSVGAAGASAGSATVEPPAPLASGAVRWDEIISIDPDGDEQVYDLTIPELHNFVAADVFVHNTSFALGMVAHAALEAQKPVLMFSLEMSNLELSQRLICSEAKVDATRVRNGQLQADDWTKISRAMGRLADAPIWIDDNPNLTIMEIRAKARRLKSQIGSLGMIVIDYLQLMSGRASAENRQVEVSELSRGLKILARELETPVVALSQLSRGLEMRADKRPMLADLRESGSIEQDSDVVMFIFREEIYDAKPENAGQAEIIVAKHRSGPTGVVQLAFLPQYTRFANMARGFD
jgi:replicative DNA helicase